LSQHAAVESLMSLDKDWLLDTLALRAVEGVLLFGVCLHNPSDEAAAEHERRIWQAGQDMMDAILARSLDASLLVLRDP